MHYKYIKSQFFDSFMTRGVVRLGTLYEYRRYENIQIGDPNEGKGIGVTDVTSGTFKKGELPGIVGSAFKIEEGELEISGITFKANVEFVDYNIFCVSKSPSESVMQEFECDKCVEISNLELFGKVIALELVLKHLASEPKCIIRDCSYKGREFWVQDTKKDILNLLWLKEPKHKPQNETRLVFPYIYKKEVAPIILEVPNLTSLLKEHKFK
jgi:hypothetical protein